MAPTIPPELRSHAELDLLRQHVEALGGTITAVGPFRDHAAVHFPDEEAIEKLLSDYYSSLPPAEDRRVEEEEREWRVSKALFASLPQVSEIS